MMNQDLRIKELEQELERKDQEIQSLNHMNERLSNSIDELKDEVYKYEDLVHSSNSLIAIFMGKDYIIDVANESIRDVWGKGHNVIGKPLLEVLPELRKQGIDDLLDQVYNTGIPYHADEVPVELVINGIPEIRYFDFTYQPQKNQKGEIIGVADIATDVTKQALLNKKVRENEYRYRELIHSSNSLIAILRGKEMVIEIANNAIKSVWGKGNDVEGKPLFEILPEMIGQGMPELFNEVYETGEPHFAQEKPLLHKKDGEMKLGYFDFVYQPQRNIHNQIDGVAVIAQDVTQQGILNKKVRESEKEFRELVNFMPHKISMSSATGEPVFYNNSWVTYTGKNAENLLENSWQSLIHPDDRERTEQMGEKVLATGQDLEMELRIFDKNGSPKWHLFRATAIKNEEGEITSWISSCTEIHKLKEEEQRKDDFLKLVSHELKTPVTSIKGYVQLLLSMIPKEEEEKENNKKLPVRPYLNRMEIQIERLIRLISEMLDLSRIEQKELQLKKEYFKLNEHVEQIIEDISYSNRDVQIELQHQDQSEVFADKDRIGQVIINFVTNALKYSPEGNRVIIKIFEGKNAHVGVSVRDFGIGIAKKEQKKIFKRFYRIAGNKDYTYAGFGIGLYLSNEIIKRHKGRIYLDSQIGKGSEFTFTLPKQKTK